jgi:Ca2+-dependent lipid-binding protein
MISKITLKIIEAKDVRPVDKNGLSDPFIIVTNKTKKKQIYKTKVHKEK